MTRVPRSQEMIAVVLAVSSCALFAGANGFAKLVQTFQGPDGAFLAIQLVFCRFIFGLMTITVIAVFFRPPTMKPEASLTAHFGRTFLGFAGVTCMFVALNFLPLADATAISFSSPLFTLIFAAIFLREFFHLRRTLATVIGFIGVILLLQPSIANLQFMSLFALLAAIFIGLELVVLRYLAQRDNPMLILIINNCLGVAITLPFAAYYWQWPTVAQWPFFVAIGVVMAFGQIMFVNAAARSEASFIAPFYFATILFAVIYGIAFFDEVPVATSLLGAGLIIASGIYIGLRTRTQNS